MRLTRFCWQIFHKKARRENDNNSVCAAVLKTSLKNETSFIKSKIF